MYLSLAPGKRAPRTEEIDWVLTGGVLLAVAVVLVTVVVLVLLWKWYAAAERKRLERIDIERQQQEFARHQQAQAWAYQQEQERLARERARQEEEAAKTRRYEALAARFGAENASRIVAGQFWIGQTADMLRASLGSPVDIEERVLKTKTKRIYKYQHMGANRYGLRITLENDVVVGWDQK